MPFRAALVGALVVLGGITASAAPAPDVIDPATVDSPAVRDQPAVDVVTVFQLSALSPSVEAAAARAAAAAHAVALPGRSVMIPMTRITRASAVVQQAPSGFFIPMGFTVLAPEMAVRLMSAEVSGAIAQGQVVISATSAGMRDARVGDTIELQAANGSLVALPIGRVATDDEVGGAELVASPAIADRLGVTTLTREVIWGFTSRAAIDAAMAAEGLVADGIRIGRSWDPPSPDSVIGLAQTKKLLGEFAFHATGVGDEIRLADNWADSHIHPRAQFDGVAVRAACHVVVHPAIQGALSEIAAQGLTALVDTASTNSVGGCFNPRYNRVTGNLGFISRHSWGQALDINVSTNPLGGIPHLDCRIVRIFRKWGFAWGGNFLSRDGMHFEWVGQPRDQVLYPSTYCPNISSPAAVPAGATPVPRPSSLATMFAQDGFAAEG